MENAMNTVTGFDTSDPAQQAKSFLASLFDISFTSLITGKLIKLLYVIGMAIAGIAALAVIVAGTRLNSLGTLLAFLISPIVFLIMLIYMRVSLELIMVFFRTEEHCSRLDKIAKVIAPQGPPPTGY
jgi:hypothetical protein